MLMPHVFDVSGTTVAIDHEPKEPNQILSHPCIALALRDIFACPKNRLESGYLIDLQSPMVRVYTHPCVNQTPKAGVYD
jgi:hypothetical protein